ncbi:MAG: DUF192 domain-containing protein [Anaerolineaceae bacterium]|nr:DUF192 domain-containing protein [Anaerolineaceae bacterium]
MKTVIIRKLSGNFGSIDNLEAWYFENFFSRLKGLMFKKDIAVNQAGLFINKNENLVDSAIHMLFMNFDIAVFWLDQTNTVVDKKIAKKWGLIYYPDVKSQKILETHTEIFEKLQIGEKIIIESL